MQVLLRKSDTSHDVRCDVCGQGFRLYWERTSLAEQATMRAIVLGELRDQHATGQGADDKSSAVHPSSPFNLPNWSGQPQFSGAALLGGLSGVRRAARK